MRFETRSKKRSIGRRRDYDEGYEDARRDMVERETGSRRGGDVLTAAVFIEYAAIVIVVLFIAYVVLRIVGVIQGAF
jgi:hypothetical protein